MKSRSPTIPCRWLQLWYEAWPRQEARVSKSTLWALAVKLRRALPPPRFLLFFFSVWWGNTFIFLYFHYAGTFFNSNNCFLLLLFYLFTLYPAPPLPPQLSLTPFWVGEGPSGYLLTLAQSVSAGLGAYSPTENRQGSPATRTGNNFWDSPCTSCSGPTSRPSCPSVTQLGGGPAQYLHPFTSFLLSLRGWRSHCVRVREKRMMKANWNAGISKVKT